MDASSTAAPSMLARLKEGGRPLAALLTAVAMFKAMVIAAALAEDPLAHLATSDSKFYLDRAAGIAGMIADPLASEPHHLPPLYPWVLAAVPGALDGSFGGVMVLQAIVGVALVAGVYLFARRRASRTAALLAAGLTAAYGPLTFFELKLLGDSLAVALLLAALLAADRLDDGGGSFVSAVLGVLLGLATLLRPQVLLLAPLLWIWAARRRRPWVPSVLAYALLLLPSAAHNWAASGDLVLVSDNGGVNLWIANTGPLSGTFANDDEAFGDIDDQASAARRVAEGIAGRRLSAGEVSSVLAREALGAIVADVPRFLERVVLRARALLESFETGVVCIPEVEMGLIPPLGIAALPFGVLAALAAASLALGAGRRASPTLPMAALTAMVVATALVFFHYSRFRLPLVPVLATLVACGWDRAREDGASILRAVGALAAAAAVLAVSWLPAPHHDRVRANGWTSIGEARLATAAFGDTETVERALEDAGRALDHDGGFVRAQLLAAKASLTAGRFDDCARWLGKIEAVVPDLDDALMTRAWLSLTPHPNNGHLDLAAARDALDRLRFLGATDPSLTPHVETLGRRLEQLESSTGLAPPAGG